MIGWKFSKCGYRLIGLRVLDVIIIFWNFLNIGFIVREEFR